MCDFSQKTESGYQTAGQPIKIKNLVSDLVSQTRVSQRYCKVRIVNRWGIDITSITLRHRRGNDPKKEDIQKWASILKDSDSTTFDIQFETGMGSHGDYWWVEFTAAADKWQCKGNFYCDLRHDDDGRVIDCILKSGDEEMHISMNSGSCSVSLYK